MADTYVGEPTPYFITVAHNVFREYMTNRRPHSELPPELPEPPGPDPDEELEYDCLEQCVQELRPAQRDLVLQYYRENKQAKIDHRKVLAEELGIGINALRIRAHRIRTALQDCVDRCLTRAPVM